MSTPEQRAGDGLKNASARGIRWRLLQNLLGRVLSLAVFAILGRLLAPEAFGGLAVAMTIIVLAEVVLTQGFGEFVAQRPALTDAHLDTAFWLNLVLGGLLTGALALTAGPVAASFESPDLSGVIRALSPVLLLRALSVVPSGLLVRELDFKALALRNLFAGIFGGLVGVACALSGAGIYSLVVQALVSEAAAAVVLWSATDWRPGRRWSRASLRDLTRFGFPLFLATMLSFVSRRLDVWIIGGALGLQQVGIYYVAQRVFRIVNQVVNKSADSVAFSALSRMSNDPKERSEAFSSILELTAVICFPVYAGLALVSDEVTTLIFGPKWSEAGPVLTVFAVSGLSTSLSFLHAAGLKASGTTTSFLTVHVSLAVMYLPMLLVLVSYGPALAAVAHLVAATAIIPVEIWLLTKALGVRPKDYLGRLVGPTLATLIMTAAVWGVDLALPPLHETASLALLALTGACAFTGALRLVARDVFVRSRKSIALMVRR